MAFQSTRIPHTGHPDAIERLGRLVARLLASASEEADSSRTSLVRKNREKSPRRAAASRIGAMNSQTSLRANPLSETRFRFFLSSVSAVASALDPFSERDTMKLD